MPQVVRSTPPAALLEPTPIPEFAGSTNGDLVDYIETLRGAIAECNADKVGVAQWGAKQAEEPQAEAKPVPTPPRHWWQR